MSPGPLRRLTGALGLLALVPTAWLLATEAITLVDAALRAGASLVVVVALGRLISWVLQGLAASFERDGDDEQAAVHAPGTVSPSGTQNGAPRAPHNGRQGAPQNGRQGAPQNAKQDGAQPARSSEEASAGASRS